MVNSLIDIKVNDAIEDIAILTHRKENIRSISVNYGSKDNYSYLLESTNPLTIELLKNESISCERDAIAEYNTFIELISYLKKPYELKEFTPKFFQKPYRKEYEEVSKQNIVSTKLVDYWFFNLINSYIKVNTC